MCTRQVTAFVWLGIGLGVLIVVLMARVGRPAVLLTVRGFTNNSWSTDNSDGTHRYVRTATIEFTNGSDRSVSYFGNRDAIFPDYRLLRPTVGGWEPLTPPMGASMGWERFVLAPLQAVRFEAEVDPTKPCKVALDYSDRRTQNGFWQFLPQWIVRRWSWAKGVRTATTVEINSADSEP